MDEQLGNVIDGTARARHWRGSRPQSTAEAELPQGHSEAPKSIASTLLVPPAMVDGEFASALGVEHAKSGADRSAPSDESGLASGHRNLFVSPEAAVAVPRKRPFARISTATVGLTRPTADAVRTIQHIRGLRPRFSSPSTRVAALLSLLGACAIATALTVTLQSPSPQRAHSDGRAISPMGFDRFKEALLASTGGVFAALRKTADAHTSVARPSHKRRTVRTGHVERQARRTFSAPARPRVDRVSTTTSTSAVVPTSSGSSAASTNPANVTPAQQSATQHTTQQQPAHDQPQSYPVGPAGLGSQVGGNCNPKCS